MRTTKLTGVAVLVACALGLADPGTAQVLDQNQPDGPAYIAAFSQTDLAQSFVPGAANSVGAGILLQPGQGTGGTVTIQLWTALPNAPGAAMLAQGSATGTPGSWVDVLWTAVPVTVGQTYYLVLLDGDMGVAGSTSNPYSNGQVYANAGFGSFPAFDYAFRTWASAYVPAPVPALGWPTGLLLVALLALAGLLCVRRLS